MKGRRFNAAAFFCLAPVERVYYNEKQQKIGGAAWN